MTRGIKNTLTLEDCLNLSILNHSFTVEIFEFIYHRIVDLFKTLPNSTVPTLNALLHERDNVIKAHIKILYEMSFKKIANAEMDVNEKLTNQTH